LLVPTGRPAPGRYRNKRFNRFLDVVPPPETRVPLAGPHAYINASYVRGPSGNKKEYIAAMGWVGGCRPVAMHACVPAGRLSACLCAVDDVVAFVCAACMQSNVACSHSGARCLRVSVMVAA